jgi:hypothetical protein
LKLRPGQVEPFHARKDTVRVRSTKWQKTFVRGAIIVRVAEGQAPIETLELLNVELKEKLSRQRDARARIDTKAGVLVGFATVSIQLGLWNAWSWFLAPAQAAALVSIVFAVSALRVRAYWDAPVPRELVDAYGASSKQDLLGALVGTRLAVYEKNAVIHSRQAKLWTVSLVALVVTMVLLVIGLLLERI